MEYDITAIGEDVPGISDVSVMATAQREERLILTFDRDYGELIFKHDQKPRQGVLYLRLMTYSPEKPAAIVHQLLTELKLETESRLTVYDGRTVRQRTY